MPKLKSEKDYIKAICGQKEEVQDNRSLMTLSVGQASIPEFNRSRSTNYPPEIIGGPVSMHRGISERVLANNNPENEQYAG